MNIPVVVQAHGFVLVELHASHVVAVALELVELPDGSVRSSVLVNGVPVVELRAGSA